jgi:DUF1680 family protein
MAINGALGRALDTRSDTFETSCGSWAGFKLARYLIQFTGEARYGDWIERLLYNGVGAGLPMTGRGRNFYYSDYRVGGGMKVYNWDTYTCCSGTYIQNLAEYHNLIYFHDATGVFVNLFLPSQAIWRSADGDVTIRQETDYPDAETSTFTITTSRKAPFSLRFRVPAWANGMTLSVDGTLSTVDAKPGSWATITRQWAASTKVEARIPLAVRAQPSSPARIAMVRGPWCSCWRTRDRTSPCRRWMPNSGVAVAEPGTLPRGVWSTGLPETKYPTNVRVERPDGKPVRLRFRPFYEMTENYPHFMYFDKDTLPSSLW